MKFIKYFNLCATSRTAAQLAHPGPHTCHTAKTLSLACWCPQVQCSAKFHSFFNKFSTLLLHNNAKVGSEAPQGTEGTRSVALHIINLSTSSDREDSGISCPQPSLSHPPYPSAFYSLFPLRMVGFIFKPTPFTFLVR